MTDQNQTSSLSKLSNRFGEAVAKYGFTALPNIFINNVKGLGLSNSEFRVLVLLHSYLRDSPVVEELTFTQMARSYSNRTRVQSICLDLHIKGWIKLTAQETGKKGKYKKYTFDLTNFFSKILDFQQNKEKKSEKNFVEVPKENHFKKYSNFPKKDDKNSKNRTNVGTNEAPTLVREENQQEYDERTNVRKKIEPQVERSIVPTLVQNRTNVGSPSKKDLQEFLKKEEDSSENGTMLQKLSKKEREMLISIEEKATLSLVEFSEICLLFYRLQKIDSDSVNKIDIQNYETLCNYDFEYLRFAVSEHSKTFQELKTLKHFANGVDRYLTSFNKKKEKQDAKIKKEAQENLHLTYVKKFAFFKQDIEEIFKQEFDIKFKSYENEILTFDVFSHELHQFFEKEIASLLKLAKVIFEGVQEVKMVGNYVPPEIQAKINKRRIKKQEQEK